MKELAILLKQRVYNNHKNHDYIQIIPDIYTSNVIYREANIN